MILDREKFLSRLRIFAIGILIFQAFFGNVSHMPFFRQQEPQTDKAHRSYVFAQSSGSASGSCTVGASCNDGNACTVGEKYDSKCLCQGGTPSAGGTSCGSGDQCDGYGNCVDCVNDGGCSDYTNTCDGDGHYTKRVCDGPYECQSSSQGCSAQCGQADCRTGQGCSYTTCTCVSGMIPDGSGGCKTGESFKEITCYRDDDNDGYHGGSQIVISVPSSDTCEDYNYKNTTSGTDCNDSDNAINPGRSEQCDGKDNNCNGTVDEGCGICTEGQQRDCGTDQGMCSTGKETCLGGSRGSCVGQVGPIFEKCDGQDNDCDGSTDEAMSNCCGGATFNPNTQCCDAGIVVVRNACGGCPGEPCDLNEVDDPGPSGCHQNFTDTVRYGKTYTFDDQYVNPSSSCTHIIKGGSAAGAGLTFSMPGLGSSVGPGQSITLFTSNQGQIQTKQKFRITYGVTYNKNCGGIETGPHGPHIECIDYTVTWCGDGILNGETGSPEECDDGDGVNGTASSTCTIDCKKKVVVPAICSSLYDGKTFYDFDGDGSAITDALDLCEEGEQKDLSHTEGVGGPHSRTRACRSDAGDKYCGANEQYCGDGSVNGPAGVEQCDEGANNGKLNSTCSADCKKKADAICADSPKGTIYDFDNNGDAVQPSQALCKAGTLAPNSFSYQKTPVGSSVPSHWTWTCEGINGGQDTTCGVNEASCGDGIVNGGEACDDGNTNPFDSCVTEVAGIPTCKIPKCGDGIVDTGREEVCDDGNTEDGDGCSSTCKPEQNGVCTALDGKSIRVEPGSFGSVISASSDLCESGTLEWKGYDPVTHTYTWDCIGSQGSASDIGCKLTERWCGDGKVNAPEGEEVCDLGEGVNGIACTPTYSPTGTPNTCTYCSAECMPIEVKGPYCGDGTANTGEECNEPGLSCSANELCSTSSCQCSPKAPKCGDGTVDAGEECNEPTLSCGTNEICNLAQCQCEPKPVVCGDGTIDAGEECNEPGLSCSTNEVCNTTQCECNPKDAICGDGTIDAGEECNEPGLSCSANEVCNTTSCQCKPKTPKCGDGVINPGEECNEPNLECEVRYECNEATCDCVYKPMCGNNMLDPGEQCDDGNMVDGDGCDANCMNETFCGDGVKDPGEECDGTGQAQCDEGLQCKSCYCVSKPDSAKCASKFDGSIIYDPDNKGDGLKEHAALCDVGNVSMFQYNPTTHERTWQCVGSQGSTDFCKATEQRCGDNKLQSNKGEQCDGTGQAQCGNGYSCRMCQCEYTPLCGNGIVDAGEQCDDGKNGRNTDGCTDECKNTVCGDGIVQKPNGKGQMERCDDGNTNNNDGCTNACEMPYCGDGIVWEGKEQCDDGNRNDADGCSNTCTISKQCGDGKKDPGEQCDDGNKKPGDGCNKRCELEVCGDDYLDKDGPDNQTGTADDEECEENSDCSGGKTCNSNCDCVGEGPKCGDGRIDAGEQCDDGNTVAGDGCFECKKEQTPSKCISLAVSDTQVTVPYSLGYVCLGTGSVFNVTLTSSGQMIAQKNTKSGIFSITTPGTYQIVCSVDGVTAPECKHTVMAGGYCEDLSVSTTGGQVPFTGSFTCDGIGSSYELVIVNQSEQVVKKLSDTKKIVYQHVFEQPGTYTAHCFVDGKSSLTCEEANLQKLIIGSGGTSTGTGGIGFPGGTGSLLNETDGYKAVDAFAEKRVNDLVQHFIRTINRSTVTRLNKGEVVLGSEVEALYKAIVVTESTIETVCENPCEAQLTGTTACGNGILEPEKGEECDDGNTIGGDKCSAYCEKEGGDGRSSSITCGNGKLDKGEECDDGNVRDGDGCNRFCRLQDKKDSDKCGDGVVDKGEECDDGDDNGERSLCTSQCTLKGFKTVRTSEGSAPKCSFIDPPAVQVNGKESEYLPFRRALEDDTTVRRGNDSCSSASDAGTIPLESMECYFTLEMSDGKTHSFSKPCGDDSLRDASRYADLQADVGALSPSRGQSYLALKDINIVSYGEFALQLTKVTYDICTKETITTEDGTSAEVVYKMEEKTYEQRVCQYNFPVTTPYFIQKGVSLSSRADDREKLANFKQLDGRTILDVSGIKPMSYASSRDTFDELITQAEEFAQKATEFVTADHPFGSLGVAVKKMPAQEVYVAEGGFTLSQNGAAGVNGGKPTTLIVLGNSTITIQGSLEGNILLLVPEGNVEFVNTDCDSNDTVQGIVVAKTITTRTQQNTPMTNTALTNYERCVGGGLTVQGVLIGLDEAALMALKNARRSTLARWFEASESLEEKIFNGAALRVEASASMWNALPPLAEGVLNTLQITR